MSLGDGTPAPGRVGFVTRGSNLGGVNGSLGLAGSIGVEREIAGGTILVDGTGGGVIDGLDVVVDAGLGFASGGVDGVGAGGVELLPRILRIRSLGDSLITG
jgi:hypothetical protein